MFNKKVLVIAALSALIMMAGCEKETTGTIKGTLILEVGQTGDVRNSRVELYEKADLTGAPVKYVASISGEQANRSDFELTDVLPGYYYLLAWKDLSGDGVISPGDIAGVYGGKYKPGEGGSQVTVTEGNTFDCGDIVMYIVTATPADLVITVTGTRTNGGTITNFTYSFNYDNRLDHLYITFPGDPTQYEDPGASGDKVAGTIYKSEGWNAGGAVMPSGVHNIKFVGKIGDESYDITVNVNVP